MGAPSKRVTSLCTVCRQLDFDYLTTVELPRSHPISYLLGSLSEISSRQSGCQFCRLVVNALVAIWNLNPPPAIIDGEAVSCVLKNRAVGVITNSKDNPQYSENFTSNLYQYANCRLTIVCSRAPPGCPATADIQCVDHKFNIFGLFDNEPLFSRRPKCQLGRVNFDLVRKWFVYCRRRHGNTCSRDTVPLGHQDNYVSYFRLIDVQRNRVVDADAGCSYIALSYVWGQTPMLMLQLSNKDQLYTDGALTPETYPIPKTIQDAMDVVRLLGERFIWVDAMCIMQDDYREKGKVIGEMDLIYSRAELTIVAASGSDANAGLPGLHPQTRNIDVFEEKMSIGEVPDRKELIIARPRLSTVIDASTWNRRGWTYQERLFSHRMLIFATEQVMYSCGRSIWCEDTILETDNELVRYEDAPLYRFRIPNDPTIAFMKQAENSLSVSMFEEYAKSVSELSRRNLSFQSDILDAFAGLLRSFRDFYRPDPSPLKYYFGHPSPWFEISLLWTPLPSSKLQRRKEAQKDGLGAEVQFPSWSWTGWIGPIEYKWVGNMEARTRAEIQWYTTDENRAIVRVRSMEKSSHPLPDWFQSSDAPRNLRDRWKPADAPVDVQQSGVPSHILSSHIGPGVLMFYSSCAFLPIIERNDGLLPVDYKKDPVRHYYVAGQYQGFISLDAGWVASHPAASYEFVVIAREAQDDCRDPGMCDTLAVMLIERKNNIAYRVGVGTVAETAWVAAECKWEFVLLL